MSAEMFLQLACWPVRHQLSTPFRIARGIKSEAVCIQLRLSDQMGNQGQAEATPYPRYGETVDACLQQLIGCGQRLAAGADILTLLGEMPAGAARNALDCAYWSLSSQQQGSNSAARLGIERRPLATATTISLDYPATMADHAANLRQRPLLKLKLGSAAEDAERLQQIRAAAPSTRMVADINEGWDFAVLKKLAPIAAALNIEMIEQPLKAGEDDMLASYRSPVPLGADESLQGKIDWPYLAKRYQWANIKLDKSGGLSQALLDVAAARQHGMRVMVGCMVASSLAMAPAFLLAQQAELVDLDGPLWLAEDMAGGFRYDNGVMYPEQTLWF